MGMCGTQVSEGKPVPAFLCVKESYKKKHFRL